MSGSPLFDLRNRLLASARFRSWAEKIPVFQLVARKRAYQLFAMAGGFIHSQVLASCVRLDLFEFLRSGARSVSDIAGHTGLPEHRAGHLLRAGAALKLLEARPGNCFGLGVAGAALVDNPGLTALIRHHDLLYRDLAEPLDLFRNASFKGLMSGLWPYAESEGPGSLAVDQVEPYTELMATSQSMVAEQVLAAFSLRRCERLLDIGGGAGVFASAAARRWPRLSVTVADLPAVAALAKSRLEAAGLDARVSVVGADVTRDSLPTGFDVVSLVRILHDHDDDVALNFLRAARQAVADDGILLIAEPMAGDTGPGPLIDAYFNVYLLAMGSGRPRRREEIADLLAAAGFSPPRSHRTRVPLITSVLSARPM